MEYVVLGGPCRAGALPLHRIRAAGGGGTNLQKRLLCSRLVHANPPVWAPGKGQKARAASDFRSTKVTKCTTLKVYRCNEPYFPRNYRTKKANPKARHARVRRNRQKTTVLSMLKNNRKGRMCDTRTARTRENHGSGLTGRKGPKRGGAMQRNQYISHAITATQKNTGKKKQQRSKRRRKKKSIEKATSAAGFAYMTI